VVRAHFVRHSPFRHYLLLHVTFLYPFATANVVCKHQTCANPQPEVLSSTFLIFFWTATYVVSLDSWNDKKERGFGVYYQFLPLMKVRPDHKANFSVSEDLYSMCSTWTLRWKWISPSTQIDEGKANSSIQQVQGVKILILYYCNLLPLVTSIYYTQCTSYSESEVMNTAQYTLPVNQWQKLERTFPPLDVIEIFTGVGQPWLSPLSAHRRPSSFLQWRHYIEHTAPHFWKGLTVIDSLHGKTLVNSERYGKKEVT
jgi:hypothetical protein